MTYLIKKSDGTFLIEVDNNAENNVSTSLILIGEDVKNYGQYFSQNFINLLDTFSNSSAPVVPLVGQLWYDNENKLLKVFNNFIWQNLSPQFDGTSGIIKISVDFWGKPVTVIATVVFNQIVQVDSYYEIANDFLQDTVIFENKTFAFKQFFPNGLSTGTTLAVMSNITLEFHGNCSATHRLTYPKLISLSGDFSGNVLFDGTSDVNIVSSFSNLYVSNSNVSINGVYSNVTVDYSGRIVNVGNVSYSDVISALGYVPYSSLNASDDNVPNKLVFRNQFGNFSANLITATTSYTEKFNSNTTVNISGDVDGVSPQFDGSSNIVIVSSRTTSGNLDAGVYNSVTVNNKGVIEQGQLVENLPVGSIILYNNSVVIPEGWALCNGSNIITPSGQTVVTPNLTNVAVGGTTYIIKVFRNIFLPSNDTIVGSLSVNLTGGSVPTVTFIGGPDIKYPPLVFSNLNVATTTTSVDTYTIIKKVRIPPGYKSSEDSSNSNQFNGRNYKLNDLLYFDFPNFNDKCYAKVTEITSNGGISNIQILTEGKYRPFGNDALGIKPNSLKSIRPNGGSGQDAEFDLEVERINQSHFVQDVDFKDNLFFDAVSMVLSGGDANAVMLSQADIFGDLSNLTVIQVIDNLTVRRLSGLPPRLGKYMLSLEDIINYSGVLQIPVNVTNFTVALQNRLMLLKVTDFSNELSYLGLYPSDDKLFGACYLGLWQFVSILKGIKTDTVGKTLSDAGFDNTGINTIDNITNELMLTYCSKMIVNAKVAIFNNKVARDTALKINKATNSTIVGVPEPLIVSQLLTTGNANIVISESLIDGIPVVFGGPRPNSNANVAFGGGSFIKGSDNLNDSVYSTINDIRYGSSDSEAAGASVDGTVINKIVRVTPGLNTGTGSKVPTGGIAVAVGASVGGTVVSPTVVSGSGYYSALFNQESRGNYNVFYNNYGAPFGDLATQPIYKIFEFQDINLALTGGTAVGIGQFLKKTLAGLISTPEAKALGITLNTNFTPTVQHQLLEIFAIQNAKYLSSKNIPTIDANLAGTHLLGPGGFEKLYSADPNVTVDQLFDDDYINSNPGILTVNGKKLSKGGIPRTVAQVRAYFELKYGTGQTWRNGVVLASKVVKPAVVPDVTTTPLPPAGGGSISSSSSSSAVTPLDLAKGVTAAASRLVSALSPPSAVTQVVSAIVPETVKQVVQVAATVTQNAATIIQKAGSTVLVAATSVLNTALQNSGQQPPAVKTPTIVGGTSVTSVKTTATSTSSSSSSSSGGGGADSGQAANKTSTLGTISGVSANNNGSISVAAAPTTRNPTSSATYGVSNTVSKPTVGGTGTTSKPSPPANGSGCFVYETEVEMADGTSKQIGTIRLGDQTRGGEVVAIHCYDGAPLYNYRGVHVSGTHYVIENNEPIMVQNSVYAKKIDDVYGLYTIDTTGRRIFANGIEFADHNGDGVIFEFFKNSNASAFNSEKEIFDEVLRQVKEAKI